MTETKFTPGPWEWRTEVCERGPIGKGKEIRVLLSAPRNGDSIARTPVLTPNWNTDQGDVWQAWISCNEANARLISAAPDLLESLTNLVGLAKLGADRLDKYHAALSDAEAALAKARGEA